MLQELTNSEFTIKLAVCDVQCRSLSISDLSRLEEYVKDLVKQDFKKDIEFVLEYMDLEEKKRAFLDVNEKVKNIKIGTESFDEHVSDLRVISFILYLAAKKVNKELTFEEASDYISVTDIDKLEDILPRLMGAPDKEIEGGSEKK